MTPVWPSALPQYALRQGYEEAPRAAKASFAADVGAPIERPKGTVNAADIAVSMRMSGRELGVFEAFVRATLARGSRDFLMPHPRSRAQTLMRLAGEPAYRVRNVSGDLWLVSFTLIATGGG